MNWWEWTIAGLAGWFAVATAVTLAYAAIVRKLGRDPDRYWLEQLDEENWPPEP